MTDSGLNIGGSSGSSGASDRPEELELGPHSFTVSGKLGEGHPGLALDSGDTVTRCSACSVYRFDGGRHADHLASAGALLPAGQPWRCEANRRSAALRQRDGGPAAGSAGPKGKDDKPVTLDPLAVEFEHHIDSRSLLLAAQRLKFKSSKDSKLDDLDPLPPMASLDLRLKEDAQGRKMKLRTSATGQSRLYHQSGQEVIARRLLLMWSSLLDDAFANPRARLGAWDPITLCDDWGPVGGPDARPRVSYSQMLESAAAEQLLLFADTVDMAHTELCVDLVYHGRHSNVYKYTEDEGGRLVRSSWLYPYVKQSSLARQICLVHHHKVSPIITFEQLFKLYPHAALGAAILFNDVPVQMRFYAAKHRVIKALEDRAASAQKPFLQRWARQLDAEGKRRVPPGTSAALAGAGAGGDGADTVTCRNCGKRGHVIADCFAKGGGRHRG